MLIKWTGSSHVLKVKSLSFIRILMRNATSDALRVAAGDVNVKATVVMPRQAPGQRAAAPAPVPLSQIPLFLQRQMPGFNVPVVTSRDSAAVQEARPSLLTLCAESQWSGVTVSAYFRGELLRSSVLWVPVASVLSYLVVPMTFGRRAMRVCRRSQRRKRQRRVLGCRLQ